MISITVQLLKRALHISVVVKRRHFVNVAEAGQSTLALAVEVGALVVAAGKEVGREAAARQVGSGGDEGVVEGGRALQQGREEVGRVSVVVVVVVGGGGGVGEGGRWGRLGRLHLLLEVGVCVEAY